MASLSEVVRRNVRAERARHGWRQADLAARLGWSQEVVSTLERGRRDVRIDDLPPLCLALGVTLGVLIQGADPADRRALGVP